MANNEWRMTDGTALSFHSPLSTHHLPLRRARRGLTLVELVVTITLAGLLGIPVGLLLSHYLEAALRSRDRTVAVNLARHEMERLESLNDFCHADLDTPVAGVAITVPGFPSSIVTRMVTCQAGDCACPSAIDGMKRVDVRVTKAGSEDPLASLTTYRTKFVTYGP